MSLVVLGTIALFVLAFALGRTRGWWVPGVLVMVAAAVLFAAIEDTGGDVGGVGALGNGVLALAAIGLGAVGLVLVVFGAVRRATVMQLEAATSSPPAEPLAAATIVRRRPPVTPS